ncbi:MAG: hypothetical protein KA169_22275, partial [Burkholderiaceae bacterium]|nr:hypothetical protein [Burkholderiaceae bacterium]
MIDEIRTAATLAAPSKRASAALDASAFDAALSAARDQRTRADDPILAPRRPAETPERTAGAQGKRSDAAAPGRGDESAQSRQADDDESRSGTDPQDR